MLIKNTTIKKSSLIVQLNQGFSLQDLLNFWHVSKAKQKKITIKEEKKAITIIVRRQENHYSYTSTIDIIYQDDTCLVVNKPAFLLVHDDGSHQDNLQDRVNGYLSSIQHPYLAQACHRLDFETSGLVLFCIHPLFQAWFDAQLASHTITKEYYCLVTRKLDFKAKMIEAPIGSDRHSNQKMRLSKTGKPSKTKIEVLKTDKNTSLVKASLYSGRKHQIRVHMASLDAPLYNDALYGKIQDKDGLLLQHFHMSFQEPLKQQTIDLCLELDPRIKKHISL